jgi:hypothetical protein
LSQGRRKVKERRKDRKEEWVGWVKKKVDCAQNKKEDGWAVRGEKTSGLHGKHAEVLFQISIALFFDYIP